MLKINIVVLNYNGKGLLAECLPSVVVASRASRFSPKITVLDNGSTDGSIDFLRQHFPDVHLHVALQNKVYCSYNEFFRQSNDDVIVILNSDIRVDEHFLDPLLEHFINNHDLFFAASRVYFFDGVTYQGDRSKAVDRFGIISADTRFTGYQGLIDQQGPTFSAGNGAFDRKKFLALGGFDELFLPGRYEDVDLCFRAWKSGYTGIYEPRSVIYHKGYASFKKAFSDHEIQGTVFRNAIFFMVKNITDWQLKIRFYFFLIPRLLFFLVTGRPYMVRAFWRAVWAFPQVTQARIRTTHTYTRTDHEVLALVGDR